MESGAGGAAGLGEASLWDAVHEGGSVCRDLREKLGGKLLGRCRFKELGVIREAAQTGHTSDWSTPSPAGDNLPHWDNAHPTPSLPNHNTVLSRARFPSGPPSLIRPYSPTEEMAPGQSTHDLGHYP